MKGRTSYVLIASLVSVILCLLFLAGIFGIWRDKLTDLLFVNKKPPQQIVLVKIDEESINEIGQWPWPRAVFGLAVDKLQGTKVIGIDVNFKEPSSRGSNDDNLLADSLRRSSVPVVLSSELLNESEIKLPMKTLSDNSIQGFANIKLASDGTVREFKTKSPVIDSFAYQIAKLYDDDLAGQVVPETGRINYYGRSGSFSSLSFRDVVASKIPSAFIENKIVIIGATASDLHDFYQTPLGIISGQEIQANIAQTFLDGRFFRSKIFLDLLAIIIMAFVISWLSHRMKRLLFLAPSLIVVFAAFNLAAFLSFNRFLVLDILYPNLSLILTAGFSITFQYVLEQKEKRFIQNTFGYYLAPEVIGEIMKNPEKLKLGGEAKTITVLFSDIRGFTTLSEKMSPEKLTAFLNRYFTVMSEAISKRGGIIDKYIGDAIMAFWGAPLDDERQSLNAVLAAKEMILSLKKFNEENKSLGQPEIDIGIGIHRGRAVIGNIGSEKRFSYSAIGDSINLASRLEGLNKEYKTNIIISQAVLDALDKYDSQEKTFAAEKLGEATVKGKSEAVTIYKVI